MLLKTFAWALGTILVLDGIWLGFVASRFYTEQLAPIARMDASGSLKPVWWAAAFVYLVLALGVTFLVVPKSDDPLTLALWGALLGAVAYGTYDMTNYSTLAQFPLKVALVDWAWGSFVCAASAAVAGYFSK